MLVYMMTIATGGNETCERKTHTRAHGAESAIHKYPNEGLGMNRIWDEKESADEGVIIIRIIRASLSGARRPSLV